MPAQNAITGDDFGTDLPQAQPDVSSLAEEKARAKFSKSKEFQDIKNRWETRIEFYQQYLPDGRRVVDVPKKDLESMWIAANAIIAEFKSEIAFYEGVREAVDARPEDK